MFLSVLFFIAFFVFVFYSGFVVLFFNFMEINMATDKLVSQNPNKDDLSVQERGWILLALDTQIAVFQRRIRAEANSDIRKLIEADVFALQTLSSRFRT